MNFEIFIKENKKLVNYSDSILAYQTLQNEYGEYYDLAGQINILFADNNIITIETNTLESDLYSFFYSINDYLELGSAGITFNEENIEMQYYKFDEGKLSIEVFDKKYSVTETEFFYDLLNITTLFFEKLYTTYSYSKHKMYLEIIYALKSKIFISKD